MKYILWVCIIIFLALSLFDGPDYYSTRSFRELWNLGHILLFGMLSFTIRYYWPWFNRFPLFKRVFFIAVITTLLSVIIELSQWYFSNGTPDIADVRRNFFGATLILFFIKKDLIYKYILVFLRIAVVIAICYELINPVTALTDEYRANHDFPVLGDFESELELSRWGNEILISSDNTYSLHGKKSLKANLKTTKYSGLSLKYFPNDWSKYNYLNFNLFNPDTLNLKMTCRVNDFKHCKNGNEYHDRFNKNIILQSGWNHYKINLEEVEKAPENRLMDMNQIQNLAIFATELSEEKIIYLDYVFLSK